MFALLRQVAAGDSTTWNGRPLKIPPLPPSGLAHCTIIDVDYWLEVRVCNVIQTRT